MSKGTKKTVKNLITVTGTFFTLLLTTANCLSQKKSNQANNKRLVDYVNPLIGTAPIMDKEYAGNNPVPGEQLYTGTVNPGAMVPDPNGYVCAGPVSGYDGCCGHMRGSGYRFDDGTIMGFTNLNGEYSDVNQLLFMPTVGAIKTIPGDRLINPFEGYRSAKDIKSERASAGYYAVLLTTYGIKAELTATKNCGFHRYTFPASKQSNVIIDLANCRPAASNASVRIINKHTIEGFQTIQGVNVYFDAVFNKDFDLSGTWKGNIVSPGTTAADGNATGAFATFNTTGGEAVLVKIGTSTQSQADAAKNLEQEIPGMDFNAIRQQAETLWTTILSRIKVEGGTEAERVNFYTGIYRMAAGPRYSWFPGNTMGGMILARGTDWVTKRISGAGGRWGGGYWGPGNVAGLVGLYKMGFRSMDINAVYRKIRNDAMTGNGKAGDAYRKYGYIPENSGVDDYVNQSIGQSYDDYALSEMAVLVGSTADHDYFLARSKNYKKLFNNATGFFTPRRADGSWILPLDPVEPHAEDVYREGNAWNYLWFNTGDIPGLVDLLGGQRQFIHRLDEFFNSAYHPKVPLRDLTGVIGLYFHGNEQYRHIPYLYNYAGQPWKSQAMVRKIQIALYRSAPAGLCGMDDYGDMEGWYVMSALGYYQVDHASGYYDIGSPLFPKVTISLEGATPGTFIIRADNVSDKNMYIQSATLNGKPLNIARFRQNDMVPGGSLVFEMGPKPNLNWARGNKSIDH